VDLDVIHSGKACILRVKETLRCGASLEHFKEAVCAAFASNHPFLILNLEGMPFIDSSGIGAIIGAMRDARNVGGDTKLVNPSPFATKTFKMIHIYSLFEVYTSEADALATCDV
jgi:anti-anti-sigma factor